MAEEMGLAKQAWGLAKDLARYVWHKMETDVLPTLDAVNLQSAKDLHNAIVPAFPDSARSVDQPGTPLTPTQYQVNESFGGYDAELDAAAARGRAVEQELGISRD